MFIPYLKMTSLTSAMLRAVTQQQGDDVAVLPLTSHPFVIGVSLDRRETYLNAEFRGLEEQVLHYEAGFFLVGKEKDTEREGLVDVGLSYVQN